MKKLKSAHFIAMIIGILGMAFGIYSLIQGQTLEESGYTVFIGLALFGTAFINHKQIQKQESEE